MQFRWQSEVLRSPDGEGGGAAPAPAPPAPQLPPAPPPPAYTPPPSTPEPGRRTDAEKLAELRAEAAQWRIAFRTAETARDDALARAQQAQEALERAKTEAVAPLTAKLAKARQSVMDTEITAHLLSLGLQDADLIGLASKMPDAPKVDVDDDFRVTGAKEFAEAFKKWKPALFAAQAPPKDDKGPPKKDPPRAPAKTSAGSEPSGDDVEQPTVDVSKMSKVEYAAFKANLFSGMRSAGQVSR